MRNCFCFCLAALFWTIPTFADDNQAVKDAARRITQVFFEGDEKSLRSLSTPMSDETWANVRLYLEEQRQYFRLERELFKKFPDEAKRLWPTDPPEEELRSAMKGLDEAEVKRAGDTATIHVGDRPFEFRLIAGEWKTDVEALVNEMVHPNFNNWPMRSKAKARGFRRIADRLVRGEFKGVAEVKDLVSKAGQAEDESRNSAT